MLVSSELVRRPKKLLLTQRKNFTNEQSSSHLSNPFTSVFFHFWKISQGLNEPCMSRAAPGCRLADEEHQGSKPPQPRAWPRLLIRLPSDDTCRSKLISSRAIPVFLPTYSSLFPSNTGTPFLVTLLLPFISNTSSLLLLKYYVTTPPKCSVIILGIVAKHTNQKSNLAKWMCSLLAHNSGKQSIPHNL